MAGGNPKWDFVLWNIKPFVLIGLILLERLFSKKESKNILFYEWMSNTRCVSVIQEEYCYNTVSL